MNEASQIILDEWRHGGLVACLAGADVFLPCPAPPGRVVPWNYEDEPDIFKTTMDMVDWAVAKTMGLSVQKLHAKRQSRDVTVPRFLAMLLISEHCPDRNLLKIGQHFHMDHTSIMYGIGRAKTMLAEDPEFNTVHGQARRILMGMQPCPNSSGTNDPT